MDTISNMLIQIKNAGMAGLPSVLVPYSNFKFEIADLLQKEGYVTSVEKKGKKVKKYIEIVVAYKDKSPRINDLKRISKPSRRVYMGAKDIKPVRNGYGISVLSTPKGVMTDKLAKKEHVGGEILFRIW